jgi:phosphoglycolate phosphatase-like HAD superfamily hydrolase
MITTILFDFDGTLADSLATAFAAFNRILRESGRPEIGIDEGRSFRSLSLRQLVKRLHVNFFAVPLLLLRMRSELHVHLEDIQPVKGIIPVLKDLKDRGRRLGVVTSNTEENVHVFFVRHGMEFFEFGSYAAGLQSKSRNIRALLRRQRLDPASTIYVGDTVQDIEASRAAGIRIAAVTWGYASRELLDAAHPDWLVEKPEGIAEVAGTE